VESHKRSIVKTFTWRVIATLVTMSVAWIILGRVSHALEIGLLDTVIKLGAYYGHERVWDRVAIGRDRPPEYNI
jgi:adenylylsulfate kinase